AWSAGTLVGRSWLCQKPEAAPRTADAHGRNLRTEPRRAAFAFRGRPGVRAAETQLEELSRSGSPDESALFAQIDRVAQARAELEKANTHLLLQLRKEMDADQIK